jgi:hypothetical protein
MPARRRLTAQARDAGLKSPFVDACKKAAAGAGGNSAMLVEDPAGHLRTVCEIAVL